jgi:hypothetical protein
VAIRSKNQAVTRHFSDSVHGGKRKALKAALAFRDEMLAKLRDADYSTWLRRKRSNNTSGIVGVARYVNVSKSEDHPQEYPYWQAFWRNREGKRHSRTFSVLTYGERKARQLAIVARKTALQELIEAGPKNRTVGGRIQKKTGSHQQPRLKSTRLGKN